MKFQCAQCGQCCRSLNEHFSIFEWEKDYLEQKAKEFDVKLNITPEAGFISENKMIVYWWQYKWDNECPFISVENLCRINSKKPITCALYPYPNSIMTIESTWKCQREIVLKTKCKRKPWYSDPLKCLPKGIAYATLLYRFFNEHNRIDFFNGGQSLAEFKKTHKFSDSIIQIKPLFFEMTRLNLVSSVFLESMKSYSFDDLDNIGLILKRMNQEIQYTAIDQDTAKKIFANWDSSIWENYHLN